MIARTKPYLPAVILIIAAAITYQGVLNCEFLTNWDDADYVTNNPLIRGFTPGNLSAVFSQSFVGNYAPIHILSYMLDFSIWGLDPAGFHLTNLILHLISGLLLHFLAIRMEVGRLAALGGAIIFLLHPVQVETVAWVSQRKNLLAMVFFLVSLHCYLHYIICLNGQRTSRRLWYLLSLVAFALALLSKSVAVILPLVLIVYDHCCRRDNTKQRRLLLEKAPFLLLALIAALVAMVTQSPVVHGGRIDVDPLLHLQIMLTMLTVLKKYLLLIVWPTGLNIIYTVPLMETINPTVAAGGAILAGALLGGGLLYRTKPRLFFWYSLFFIGLLPVSQIVPLITLMNDRYLYFPMAGLSVLAATGAARLLGSSRTGHALFFVILLLLAASLGTLSHKRVKTWQNTLSLWKDATDKSPASAAAWSGRGNALEMTGRKHEALDAYRHALDLSPDDRASLESASLLYQKMGMLTESQTLALRLVRRYPRNVDGWLTIGENFVKIKDSDKAEAAFRKVLEIEPGNPTAADWLKWLKSGPAER